MFHICWSFDLLFDFTINGWLKHEICLIKTYHTYFIDFVKEKHDFLASSFLFFTDLLKCLFIIVLLNDLNCIFFFFL